MLRASLSDDFELKRCQGMLFATKCRHPQLVPVTGSSFYENGLRYEEWVPISFSSRLTCNADALQFVCHPWDSDGSTVQDQLYLFIHKNQLQQKWDHQNQQIKWMTNHCER
jgi:hypothetical protein